jgi:hypothetical protein
MASCCAHAVYNDEDPASGEEFFSGAHAKGVVVERNGTVTWLQHSVPKFPLANASYAHAQSVYGQHFMCVQVRCKVSVVYVINVMNCMVASAHQYQGAWHPNAHWQPAQSGMLRCR